MAYCQDGGNGVFLNYMTGTCGKGGGVGQVLDPTRGSQILDPRVLNSLSNK